MRIKLNSVNLINQTNEFILQGAPTIYKNKQKQLNVNQHVKIMADVHGLGPPHSYPILGVLYNSTHIINFMVCGRVYARAALRG